MIMTWYQVGIVSKELLGIGWRTIVFPCITAVLLLQVGFLVLTRQSLKEWSLAESVITGQTAAVIGIIISE